MPFQLLTGSYAAGKTAKPWLLSPSLSWFGDASEEIMHDIEIPWRIRIAGNSYFGWRELMFFQIWGLELEEYKV